MSDEVKVEVKNEIVAEAPKAEEAFPQCPRCGWSVDPKLKPSEDDVKEYFRAVLGGRPFTKTYNLAGGRIKMTFSTISAAEQAESERVLSSIDSLGEREANAVGIRARILYHLRSVALDGGNLMAYEPASLNSVDDVMPKFKAQFAGMGAPLLDMAARTLLLFLELNRELLAATFDENFWKGAGPR